MGRVKGSLLQTRFDYLDEKCTPEQKQAVLDAVIPEVRELLEKGVVAISWYPITYYYDFLRAFNHALGKGDHKILHELGRYTAHKSLRGIYKIFVKVGSPEFYIKRSPLVWSRLFDFGSLKVDIPEKQSSILTLEGFEDMPEEFIQALYGWVVGMLEVCGAKEVNLAVVQKPGAAGQVLKMQGNWRM